MDTLPESHQMALAQGFLDSSTGDFKREILRHLVGGMNKLSLEPAGLHPHAISGTIDPSDHLVRYGINVYSASGLSLGGYSNFLIINQDYNSVYYLHGSITIPANVSLPSGWLYLLMNFVQVTFPGSQSLQWPGDFCLLALMRSMSNQQRQFFMNSINPYVQSTTSSQTITFAVPLYMPSMINTRFTCDNQNWYSPVGRSKGQINVQVNWNAAFRAMNVEALTSPTLPTAFNFLELKSLVTVQESYLLNPSVNSTESLLFLDMSPYPAQNFSHTQNAAESISIQSIPSGMLVDILVSAYDAALQGNVGLTGLVSSAQVPFSSFRFQYNGDDQVRLQDAPEVTLYSFYNSVRDDPALTYPTVNISGLTGLTGLTAATVTNYFTEGVFPSTNSGRPFDSNKYFIAKDYNSKTIQFLFTSAYKTATLNIYFYLVYLKMIQIGPDGAWNYQI